MIYKIEQFKIKSTVAEGYQLQYSFTLPPPTSLVITELYFKKPISRGPLL